MGNLARHCKTLVEDMTPIKRTLPGPCPGPSHQSIPAILVCQFKAAATAVQGAHVSLFIYKQTIIINKRAVIANGEVLHFH